MTPEEAKQWLAELVSRMQYKDNGYLNSDQNAYNRGIAEQSQSKTQQVADLIATLTAERDGLAAKLQHANSMLGIVDDALVLAGVSNEDADGNEYGFAERIAKLAHDDDAWAAKCDALALQVVQMREALDHIHNIQCSIEVQRIYSLAMLHGEPYKGLTWQKEMHDARRLTPTAAEAQVKEWRKNAELLEWLFEADDFLRVSALYDAWNGEDSFLDYCRAAREKASDAGK